MVVGSTLNKITDSYFVIDGTTSTVESTIRAVAVTFYAHHALYASYSYSMQSARLWVVLAQALFGLTDPTDKEVAVTKASDVQDLVFKLRV